MGVKPAGKRSVNETFVATAPPWLVTVISNVTVSPSAGVLSPLPRVFTVTRSAEVGLTESTVTASSRSSPTVEGSTWSPIAAVVVLTIVFPPWPASTVPSSVRVATSPFASVPIDHTPVAALYVPCEAEPLPDVAVIPAGSESVSDTLVACAEPLFTTLISKITVSPSAGVLSPLASDLTVTRSAKLLLPIDSVKSSPSVVGSS